MELNHTDKLIKGVFLLKDYFDEQSKFINSSLYENMSRYNLKGKMEIENSIPKITSPYFKWTKKEEESKK